MSSYWKKLKESWLSRTVLSEENSKWALEAINKSEEDIAKIEELVGKKNLQADKFVEIESRLKKIRSAIKVEISKKENSLDELILNPSNSSKLQLSVPTNLNYLMKAWAAAEGRDLSSVALQCLEAGLRSFKSKGSIPIAAIKRYDHACEKRIALSEISSIWSDQEEFSLNK